MARKCYTCIIVPDASQALHKLGIPIQALYVLAAIGVLSFFVAVGLGFQYIGMASRMENLQTLEAENAKLKVDTRQLRLSTSQLSRRIAALEDEADIITKAMQQDPLLRKLTAKSPSMGGSTGDVPTADLLGSPTLSVEALNGRLDDLEREMAPLDAGTKYLRSTPSMWPILNG